MSQSDRLYTILQDGLPHRSDALLSEVYNVGEGIWLARLGARVHDVKRKYGVFIKGWKAPENPKLYYYQLQKQFKQDLFAA